MHIDSNNLVGTVVAERLVNNGAISFVLNDVDSTPSREFKTTKYLQTKELTSIGVAVKEYGTIIVPLEVVNNSDIDKTAYAVIVKWGEEKYAVALSAFLELEEGSAVTFAPYVDGTYKGMVMGLTVPPFNAAQKGKLVAVNNDGTGLEWKDSGIPSITGNANKYLRVKSDGTATEWVNINLVPSAAGNPKKVLKVNNQGTSYSWADETKELPTVTGHTGQFLNVANDGVNVQWKAISEVPSAASADAGKVLGVQNGGGYAWVTPTGGVPALPDPEYDGTNLVLTTGADGSEAGWSVPPIYLHIFNLPASTGDSNIQCGNTAVMFLSSSATKHGTLSAYLLDTVGNNEKYRFVSGTVYIGSSYRGLTAIGYKRQGGVWTISTSDDTTSTTLNFDTLDPVIIPILPAYLPNT